MSLDQIRTQYKTILLSVPGIGVVHEYSRLATDWQKFLSMFENSDGKILGWEITRESIGPVQKKLSGLSPSSIADRPHGMLIRGYHGLRDAVASEKTFQDLIDAILNKFLPLPTLNGAVVSAEEMTATTIIERQFGAVLCHYVELRQTVWERITF
jgi:hypothetical protein